MATTVPRKGSEVPDAPLSPASDADLFDDLDPLLEIPGARRSSAGSCSAGLASSTGEWSMFSFDGNAEDDECSWNNNNNFDEKQEDRGDAEVVTSGSVEVDHAVAAADPAAEGAGVGRRVFPRQRRRMSCPMMGGTSSGPPVSIVSMEAPQQVTPPDELELSERLFDEKFDPFDESLGEVVVDTAKTSEDELLAAAAGASTKRSRTAEPEGTTSAATPFVRAKRRMSCPSIGIGDHHLGSFEPEPIPLPSHQPGQSKLEVDFGHQPSSQVAPGTGTGFVSHPGYHLMTEQSRFILNNMPHPNKSVVGGTNVGQFGQAAAPDTAGAVHTSRESMMRYALSVLSKRNVVGRQEAGVSPLMQQSRSDVDGKGNATDQQPKPRGEAPRVKGRNRKKDIFPQKLMKLLDDEKHQDVVRWLPDGEAFVVLKRQEFVRTALPGFFGTKEATKYESFTRKLNRWGFDRLIPKEREKSERVYCHEYFKRDDPDLCLQMRTKDELDRLSTKEQSDSGLDPISPSLVSTNIQASREGVNCADRLNDGIPRSIKPFVGADFSPSPNGGATMNGMPGMMDALHLQHQVQRTGAPSCYLPPVSGNGPPDATNMAPLSSQTGVDQLNHNANSCMMYVEPSPPVSSAKDGDRLERKPLT